MSLSHSRGLSPAEDLLESIATLFHLLIGSRDSVKSLALGDGGQLRDGGPAGLGHFGALRPQNLVGGLGAVEADEGLVGLVVELLFGPLAEGFEVGLARGKAAVAGVGGDERVDGGG